MELSFSDINWIAVLLSLLLSFALGAFWHSGMLFGKAWTADSGTPYNKDNHGNPAIIFGLSAILHLIALIALALFIGSGATAIGGLLKGLFISVAWIATSMGVTYIFAGRSLRLFLIDAGFYVVFFLLSGLIIGALQ